MHKFLFYYIPLHVSSTMFSSSGGQNCIIQHLVSSHSVCGRPAPEGHIQSVMSGMSGISAVPQDKEVRLYRKYVQGKLLNNAN